MKKILSLILAAALIFSTVPVFAGEAYSVTENITKPLTVSYGLSGVNYVSLGDSIAYGYGLDQQLTLEGLLNAEKLDTYAKGSFLHLVPGSYPDLIRTYLEGKTHKSVNILQGAVCGSRIDDACTLIDDELYPGDNYYTDIIALNFIPNNDEKAKIGKAVEKADLITVTAGGNNMICYPLASMYDWISGNPLSDYYGSSEVAAFKTIKATVLAEAALLDKLAKKSEEDSYKSTVETIFKFLEAYLYTTASFATHEGALLDLIHEKNPHAVVAITGIPGVLTEYNLKIGSITINLDSALSPMYAAINTVIKNAAEERSAYARYVDIFDVELMSSQAAGVEVINGKKTIDVDYLKNSLNINEGLELINIVHPTADGHKEIQKRVLEKFTFKQGHSGITAVRNGIENAWATLMSKTGLLRLANFAEVIKSFKPLGIIALDLGSLFKS